MLGYFYHGRAHIWWLCRITGQSMCHTPFATHTHCDISVGSCPIPNRWTIARVPLSAVAVSSRPLHYSNSIVCYTKWHFLSMFNAWCSAYHLPLHYQRCLSGGHVILLHGDTILATSRVTCAIIHRITSFQIATTTLLPFVSTVHKLQSTRRHDGEGFFLFRCTRQRKFIKNFNWITLNDIWFYRLMQ